MYDIENTFQLGDRVELHPATDSWMRGDKFGDIVKITSAHARNRTLHPKRYHVKLDRSGKTIMLKSDLITWI